MRICNRSRSVILRSRFEKIPGKEGTDYLKLRKPQFLSKILYLSIIPLTGSLTNFNARVEAVSFWARYKSNEKGATGIALAISFPAIIGACLFMTEVGFWRLKKSDIQNTADMAALAAGLEYIIAADKRAARVAAYADAVDNSFDPALGSISMVIPPTSGDYAGLDAVQVTITQDLPLIMGDFFLSEPPTANVSAVAVFGGQSSPACVLSLGPSGTTILVGGNVDVNLDGCGIHSNSTSSTAINAFGSVTISAACLAASGGVSFTGEDLEMDECASPRENQPTITDPYADVDVPAGINGLGCSAVPIVGNGSNATPVFPDPAGGVVKICDSNIDIRGTVNLAPGTYVFDGTELDFQSHGTLVGDDVTLIFMNNGEISGLNGNNTLDIQAPATGDYAGIAIYGDRNSMSSNTWDFQGNADVSITGVVYLPTLNIDYGGGAGTNATECTQLVAYSIEFIGNSGFQSNCDMSGTRDIIGGAFTSVMLVE